MRGNRRLLALGAWWLLVPLQAALLAWITTVPGEEKESFADIGWSAFALGLVGGFVIRRHFGVAMGTAAGASQLWVIVYLIVRSLRWGDDDDTSGYGLVWFLLSVQAFFFLAVGASASLLARVLVTLRPDDES